MRSAIIAALAATGLTVGGTTVWKSGIVSSTTNAVPSACSGAADGDICASDDVTAGDDLVATDDLTVGDDLTVTDDMEVNGNITLENDETIKNDNNGEIEIGNGTEDTAFSWGTDTCVLSSDTGVVGFDLGTVGTTVTLAMDLTFVSVTDNELQIGDNSEDISFGFSSNTVTLSTDTAVDKFDYGSIGLVAAVPALLHHTIRFCGNGMSGADDHFMGPAPFDDTEADMVTGGAGCDGLDANTVAGADELPSFAVNMTYKPVAMVCSGICTGASAANDTVTFVLYDDTAAVTDITCSFAFGGDATANQCTVTDASPATVAAGSLVAVQIAGTDDACSDAGDDFECFLYVTF